MPSFTATRTSVSSMEPPTPKNWPRKPSVWGFERWLSPITMGSTGWSGSPRPPASWVYPPCSGLSSPWVWGRGDEPRNGPPDPPGEHLVVLARDPEGYARLGRAISEAQMAGEKARPVIPLDRVAEIGGQGHWLVLTSGRKGRVPAALLNEGPARAERELAVLTDRFGPDNVAVELWHHGDPIDSARNDALARLGHRRGLPVVATNQVHYATPTRRRLATALAAVRARRSLDEAAGWSPPAATAHLRSGDEQALRFGRWPGVVERAAELALDCAFDLSLVAPQLPPFPCPPGHDEMSWLRELTERGASRRYGSRQAERMPGAWKQIDHELALIEQLGFPGYFLVVWDIVEFCRKADILCQGRGSAANSAVCFALGITNADAVSLGLLFERFLSPERDGPPDIDIDIESDRREEAIQYVYERHGRITTAPRWPTSSPTGPSRRSATWPRPSVTRLGSAGRLLEATSIVGGIDTERQRGMSRPADTSISHCRCSSLAAEVEHFPRHLGIHFGGHGHV